MPNTFTQNTFATTYNDDWTEGKGYHKVLFNGGRALQARELNEMQSIIQAEIQRLGNNLFKNGAIVNPGGVSVNNSYEYVRLNATGGDLSPSHVGSTITGQTSGVVGRIVQYVLAGSASNDTTNVPTIYVAYTDTSAGTSGGTAVRFTPGEVLTCSAGNLLIESASTSTSGITPLGTGCKVSVAGGDIFVLGHFVHVNPQSLILSKYFSGYTGNVGFKVVQDIFTSSDTVDLFDNQSGTPNLTSPGADRYRIRLLLAKEETVKTTENFVFLARITEGVVTQAGTGSNQYNKINDVLAKRTFEESGNYMVEPFKIQFEQVDSAVNDKLYLNISKGIAYINGHRAVAPAPTRLVIPKPTSAELVTNEQIPVIYDRYIVVDNTDDTTHRGLPELNTPVNVYNGTGAGGSIIGTITIRAIERGFGNTTRLYIGKSPSQFTGGFRTARSIGLGATDYYNIVLEGNPARAVVKGDERNKDLLFRLPRPRPSAISDITYTYQFEENITGTGTTRSITTSDGFNFTDTSNWIVASADSGQVPVSIVLNGNSTQADISGLQNNINYEVAGYKVLANAVEKNKYPTIGYLGQTPGSVTTSGNTAVSLGQHDVYQLAEVKDSAAGDNISQYFTLDGGQKDTHYEESRLIKRYPYSGPVYAKFYHYARQPGGNFYSVESYLDNVTDGLLSTYDNIPTYQPRSDATTRLFNVLDFRPDLDASGNVVNGTDNFFVPKRATNITADVSYYLPRADKLLFTQEGKFMYMQGVPSTNPQYRKTPEGALELYKVLMNANTLNPSDIKSTHIESRRYTMADIGKIEQKVDRLEEVTSLSLLELDTKNLNVLDADGNLRTKSGFFADNFADQVFSATSLPDYRASVDMASKVVRPIYDADNIRLVFDVSASKGVVKKGDNVYLQYEDLEWQSINISSGAEPVNPFLIPNYNGTMKLSPASDEWKDVEYAANKVVDGGQRIDKIQAYLWNEHEWNWAGSDPNTLEVGSITNQTSEVVGSSKNVVKNSTSVDDGTTSSVTDTSTTTTTTTTAHTVSRIVSSETIQEVIGDRIVQTALIPWMRSRRIWFMAEGLRPNTNVFPYFDGYNVSNWCRQESTYVQWADRPEDNGNANTSRTTVSHPQGSTALTTDASGTVIGSFFIPNIRPPALTTNGYNPQDDVWRFRCGALEFKLLDVNKNNDAAAICKASSVYTAAGTLQTRQKEVLSTRVLGEVTTVNYTEDTLVETESDTTIQERVEVVVVEKIEVEVPAAALPPEIIEVEVIKYVEQDPIIIEVIVYEDSAEPNTDADNTDLPAEPAANDPIIEAQVEVENGPLIDVLSNEGGVGNTSGGTVVESANLTLPYGYSVPYNYVTIGSLGGAGGEGTTTTGTYYPGPTNTSEQNAALSDTISVEPDVVLVEAPALISSINASISGNPVVDPAYSVALTPAVQTAAQFDPEPNVAEKVETVNPGGNGLLVDGTEPRNISSKQINHGVYPTKKTGRPGGRGGKRGLNVDPVAQTFYVDNQYGIYMTKVALFFATKDPNIPVRVEIRPEVNGAPSAFQSMTSKTLAASQVTAVTETYATPTMAQINSLPTIFEFDEPVFLSPFTGYAICVIAPNTVKYNVYVAEMEKFVLGSSDVRILKQPSLGSFFKSQNSRIWEPSQQIDMMYKIYRASFKRSGFAILNNADVPAKLLKENPIYTTAGSPEIYVEHKDCGLLVNDMANVTGLDSSTSYGGILGSAIMGRRAVTKVDGAGYAFNADTNATVTSVTGGDDVYSDRNVHFNIANLEAQTIVPNYTSVSAAYKFTTGKPVAGPEPAIISPYDKATVYSRITPKINTSFDYPKVVANRYNENLPGNLNGGRSATVKIDFTSSAGFVSPMLDLQRCSLTLIENIIDDQDASSTANGKIVPIKYIPETDPYNGTHLAKHITVPVTLAEDAVGIKVLLAANRPNGSNFDLYYRTAAEGENIIDKSWILDTPENTLPSDDNPSIFREYTYLIGGDDGTLDSFSEYQLKIVFRSVNSSAVPKIRDLRAIAMVD